MAIPKQYFIDQPFSKQTQGRIALVGGEYSFTDNKAYLVNPDIDNKKVFSFQYNTKEALENDRKAGKITPQMEEDNIKHTNLVRETREKFEGKNLKNPTPEDLVRSQEKWATETVIYTQFQPYEFNSRMEEIIDPFTGKQKVESQSQEQKIKLALVVDSSVLRQIKLLSSENQYLPIDLEQGFLSNWQMIQGTKVNAGQTVFAKYLTVPSQNKKLELTRSKISEFNIEQGLVSLSEEEPKQHQPQHQEQPKPQPQPEPKKEDKK